MIERRDRLPGSLACSFQVLQLCSGASCGRLGRLRRIASVAGRNSMGCCSTDEICAVVLCAATWQAVSPDPLDADPLAPFALPLGTYRLRATGRAQAPGGIEPYTVPKLA